MSVPRAQFEATYSPRRWNLIVQERDAWRELAEAQAALLVAYRTGNSRRAGPAADRLAKARKELVRLGQDVSRA